MARLRIRPNVVKDFARSTARLVGAKAEHTVFWGALGVLGALAALDRIRYRFRTADRADRCTPTDWPDDRHLGSHGTKGRRTDNSR